MTFKEIYQAEREKPTPALAFLRHISEITCRELTTIRMWVSGVQEPTDMVKERIAEELGRPVEELFPKNNRKGDGNVCR